MTELAIISNQQTMSSREIAELTDKQHAHVLRDIRAMLKELGEREQGYLQNWIHPQNGQAYEEFVLNRELTDCLLTGYSAVARMRVIKRWRELEQKVEAPTPQLSITAKAVGVVEDTLRVANLLSVPLHYAQVEAVKTAKVLTGVDFAGLLPYSTAQDSVSRDDEMLEPDDLGKRFNLSGKAVNLRIQGAGLQNKVPGGWEPTALAAGKCARHHWANKGKTGYNWKWKVSSVSHLMGAV